MTIKSYKDIAYSVEYRNSVIPLLSLLIDIVQPKLN